MSSIATTFDSAAQSYEQQLQLGLSLSGEKADYFVRGRVAALVNLARLYAETPPKNVLDFGCGVGNAVPEILDGFPGSQLTGVDCSIASLALAHRRFSNLLRYRHRVQWIRSLETLKPQTFDIAYSSGVFHHILPESRQQELNSIFESLTRGGLFALCENNPWNIGTRWVMSRIPFDRDAICLSATESRNRLVAAGFEVIETRFLFFFPRPLAPFRVIEPLLKRVPLGAQYLVLARRP
jgi:SAM-dependent methyltransferase